MQITPGRCIVKRTLLSICVALSLTTFNLSVAEEMRSAAPASASSSLTATDCDDTDRACSPARDLDNDCDGAACDSASDKQAPSTMAPGKEAIQTQKPGLPEPATAKDKPK
jgi:hypothetical protein